MQILPTCLLTSLSEAEFITFFFWEREAIQLCMIKFVLYNMTVNTQHTSRQDAIITIRLYLTTCFGRKRPSSGHLRTILRYSKNSTQWNPIEYYFYCKDKAVPLQAWSGPEGPRKLRFPDFMTTAQDYGKVVGLTHRPPLPPGSAPGTHFCWRLSRPQSHSAIGRILCQWKIPMTRTGMEPATFRFVTQHLNPLCCRCPHYFYCT